ncbi:MAG: ATP-binding cassette domain-containing protein [bacterium]
MFLLAERRHQKAGTMSGREQQMLAIGRGLMMDPHLMLLDEPSLGLAPKFVNFIFFDKISELSSMGKILVVVEQNAAKVLSIADRGYVLELGENRYTDTGQGLLANDEIKRLYLGG